MPGRLGTALLLALGAGAGFALASWLPWGPGAGAQRARAEQALIETREALDRAHRLMQVDQRAAAELQAALERAQRQRAELARQLAVYERVLADPAGPELAIEDVSVYHAGPGGTPRFRVVLAQGAQGAQRASGTFELWLRARSEGEWLEVPLARREYGFHHLQVLDGDVHLPAGAQPVELRVRLTPAGEGKRLERVFAWDALVGVSTGPSGGLPHAA